MLGALRAILPGAAFAQSSAAVISLWAFDETDQTSGVFQDLGPADVPMTLVGPWADLTTDSIVQGVSGTSAYTDGSAYATLPANHPAHDLAALTLSFYYQRNNSATKQTLLAAGALAPGAETQPGDFSIEVLTNGRLRAFHVGQDSVARFFEGPDGITGTNLEVGTAHRIDVTFGPRGAGIFLDGTEVAAILANVNGWNNARVKYLGRWSDGVLSPAHGAFDRFRIWYRQLGSAEIALLEPAQTITLPINLRPYTVPVAPSAPGAGAIYVAPTGNDAGGNGSIGSPYRTLSRALSVVNPGGEIVMRAGVYRSEENLTVADTNVTIKGYAPDISVDPLDPDNWPIIDGCFTGLTWELFNAARNEWRTTGTGHGVGTPQCHVVVGTTPYQIPRWEPLGGRRVPTPVYRLYPYFSQSGPRGSTSFRGGAPTSAQDWSCYHGPGVMRESDGRIHIRLDPVHPSYYGGVAIDKFSSKNPNGHQLFIHQIGKTLFSSIASGFSFEGILVRGYDKFFWGSQNNVTIHRNVLWGCDYYFGLIQFQGTSNNWLFQHNVFELGFTDWTPYQLVKQNLVGGFGYGQLVPIWGTSTSTTVGFKFLDNLLPNCWAAVYIPNASATSDIEVAYNAMCTRDDADIFPPRVGKRHFHHNYIEGPTYGVGTATASPSTFEFYSHHNVVVCNRMTLEFLRDRRGHGMCNKHNSASNMVIFEYHNTYVANQPDVYGTGMNMGRPFLGGYVNASSTPHRTFNNIFTWYVQVPPGGSSPGNRYVFHDFAPNDPDRKWFANGDGYWAVHGPGVTGSKVLFGNWEGNRGTGSERFYASLDNWRASNAYANTGGTGWNFGGRRFEQDAIQADPQFEQPNAITQDARYDHPPADYKPGNAAYHSGAIDITSFNWPGATVYQPWRGALDPNGDGSEIGPR